jgi:hypothetical protein
MIEFKVPCHATVFQHCEAEEIVVDFNNGWSASIIAQPMPPWKQSDEPRFQISVHYDCEDMPCGEVISDLTQDEVEEEIAMIGIASVPGSLPWDFDPQETPFVETAIEGEFVYA